MAEQTPETTGSASAPSDPSQQTAAPNALDATSDNQPGAGQTGGAPGGSGPAAAASADGKPPKQPSKLRQFLRRVNVYLLLFALIVVVGAVIGIVSYLNSRKAPASPSIASQELTADTLKQLANSDATVGASGQTLTVEGNAIFSGQELVRSDLDVAGNIQLGGVLNTSSLTVSNSANLANTQINSLQVANTSILQGTVTIQQNLSVGGSAAFSGPVTAGQITVTKLILSGNAQLEVPNHIAFPGASPNRSINPATLGIGGSASLSGSDTTGTVNINTGSDTQPGCFITITFNQHFASQPHVTVTPIGAGAGQTQYYVNRSTTSFSICTDNAAPTGQTFAYDYFITD